MLVLHDETNRRLRAWHANNRIDSAALSMAAVIVS